MTDTATIRAIKGFDADLSCRGHKFEVGQTYTATGEIVACKNGFHAIPEDQHPLAVFNYYPPAGSRFCIVEVGGKTDADGDKVSAEILSVGLEVGLRELTLEAVKWVTDRATLEGPVAEKMNGLATASGTSGAATASGYEGAATASGEQGAATASGEQGAATASGEQGAATASGYQGAATASGEQGAATASGEQGAATASGYQGAATASGEQGAATASGYQGAATASGTSGAATASGTSGAATASGYQGAATASGTSGAATASGEQGAATASGYQGAATASGYQGAATASGEQGCALGIGPGCRVMGEVDGIDLFAREFSWTGAEWRRVSIACGTTGLGGIRAGVWYRCVGGALVEADQ